MNDLAHEPSHPSSGPSAGGALPAADEAAPAWMRMTAEDLRTLAWLHVQEHGASVLADLLHHGFPAGLSILSADHPEVEALRAVMQALASTERPGHRAEGAGGAGATDDNRSQDSASDLYSSDDDLAADFVAIYLTHGLRAAPYESVWRDEDHLMMQAPTFAVREFYQRHGVQVQDWRHRPDDHLSHELNFVAFLLERGQARDAARFLAEHLMTWLPDFAERVGQRAQTPFYAALALLTLACCKACQERLPKVAVLPPVVSSTPGSGCAGVA